MLYRGTFPGRDDDTIGFAIADAEISDRQIRFEEQQQRTATGPSPVQSRELDLELNYGIQVAKSVSVMPNLQYIIHPGAVNEIGNAFVLGLKTAIRF